MLDSRGGDKGSANGNAKGKEAGGGGRSGEVATTQGRRARARGGVGRATPRWCARRMSTMCAACGSMCCARATSWSKDTLTVDHGGSRSVGLSLEAPPTKQSRVEGAAACGCPSRLQEARCAPEDARSVPDRQTPIATRDRRFRLARGHFERLCESSRFIVAASRPIAATSLIPPEYFCPPTPGQPEPPPPRCAAAVRRTPPGPDRRDPQKQKQPGRRTKEKKSRNQQRRQKTRSISLAPRPLPRMTRPQVTAGDTQREPRPKPCAIAACRRRPRTRRARSCRPPPRRARR